MPRKKEYKSKYPSITYRHDIKMWQVRIRKKNLQVYETFHTQEDAEHYYIRLQNCMLPSQMRSIDKALTVVDMVTKYIQQNAPSCKTFTIQGYYGLLNSLITY